MRRVLLSALTLVVLLTAGCGGGQTAAQRYQKELDTTTASLKATFSSVGAGLTNGASLATVVASLNRGAEAFDKAAKAFDKIDPPDEAKAGHAELVTGLHLLAKTFSDSARATRGGDKEKIAAAIQAVARSEGTKKIAEAETKLRKAGFVLPGAAPTG